MTRGGARISSGPPPDPNSGRSERRGYRLDSLPAAGFDGEVPDFPLMTHRIYRWEYEDKRRFQVVDEDATELFAERERALWEWLWRTPQACAWSMPTEAWRLNVIAMYARTFTICESSESTAADKSSLHRFADQIGMTTAGLAAMGWVIVPKLEVAPEPESDDDEEAPAPRRLSAVQGA